MTQSQFIKEVKELSYTVKDDTQFGMLVRNKLKQFKRNRLFCIHLCTSCASKHVHSLRCKGVNCGYYAETYN